MAKKKVLAAEGADIQEAVVIEKPESRFKAMWDTLKKNKAALFGLFVIIILVIMHFKDRLQIIGLELIIWAEIFSAV